MRSGKVQTASIASLFVDVVVFKTIMSFVVNSLSRLVLGHNFVFAEPRAEWPFSSRGAGRRRKMWFVVS